MFRKEILTGDLNLEEINTQKIQSYVPDETILEECVEQEEEVTQDMT